MAVREISWRGHHAWNANEICRRSDGYRPHVQRGAAKGHSLARAAHSLACAGRNAGFAASRDIIDAAPGSHSLAAHRGQARAARGRAMRPDETRFMVHYSARIDKCQEAARSRLK